MILNQYIVYFLFHSCSIALLPGDSLSLNMPVDMGNGRTVDSHQMDDALRHMCQHMDI